MKPLIDKKLVLEKFKGKGGWTYVQVPIIGPSRKPFGWVKVKGFIDGYEIKKYHLMPMGNGRLFLPVKAAIRKMLQKCEGDSVRVILYADDEPLDVPEEMMLCLREEPKALRFFNALSESERKYYIDWVYSAKKDETKVDRLAKTVNRLSHGLKMNDRAGASSGHP